MNPEILDELVAITNSVHKIHRTVIKDLEVTVENLQREMVKLNLSFECAKPPSFEGIARGAIEKSIRDINGK